MSDFKARKLELAVLNAAGLEPAVQANRDFFNGTAMPGYIPLRFPHPLAGGPVSSTNPVVSLNTSSIDFGSVPTGTTKDLTVTVQNSGGGTLSGSAAAASPREMRPPTPTLSGAKATASSKRRLARRDTPSCSDAL